jgi:hypothetical protein
LNTSLHLASLPSIGFHCGGVPLEQKKAHNYEFCLGRLPVAQEFGLIFVKIGQLFQKLTIGTCTQTAWLRYRRFFLPRRKHGLKGCEFVIACSFKTLIGKVKIHLVVLELKRAGGQQMVDISAHTRLVG